MTHRVFAPAVVLLGIVSPFAIRLAVSSIATAGAVAGRLYALSTAGSLLGVFLPALVLIPAVGTQRTFLVIAALLAASSCFLLGARYLVVTGLVAFIVVRWLLRFIQSHTFVGFGWYRIVLGLLMVYIALR